MQGKDSNSYSLHFFPSLPNLVISFSPGVSIFLASSMCFPSNQYEKRASVFVDTFCSRDLEQHIAYCL